MKAKKLKLYRDGLRRGVYLNGRVCERNAIARRCPNTWHVSSAMYNGNDTRHSVDPKYKMAAHTILAYAFDS